MYYCKNCGEPYMTDEAVMCVKCGVSRGQGRNYCHHCGKPVAPESNVCLSCGVSTALVASDSSKSKIAAGLFGIFLGCFGVHNFYLGYTSKAITQLVLTIVGYVTICFFGLGLLLVFAVAIWALVEGIMILAGKIETDANGIPLKD